MTLFNQTEVVIIKLHQDWRVLIKLFLWMSDILIIKLNEPNAEVNFRIDIDVENFFLKFSRFEFVRIWRELFPAIAHSHILENLFEFTN